MVFRQSEPMSTYVYAVCAGEYDVFSDVYGEWPIPSASL